MRAISALFGVLLVSTVAAADAPEWTIDPSHSHVGFSVSHMVVSSVSGRFRDFSGKVLLDDGDLTKSQIDITIKADSIDTDEPKRDAHLKSPDFFDAAKFPTLTFHSTKIVHGGKGFKLTGDLRIRDVSKSVTLDGTLSKPVDNPFVAGKRIRAAAFSTKIKRSDFGLTWNKSLDKGGVVVGDEITLDVQVELDK